MLLTVEMTCCILLLLNYMTKWCWPQLVGVRFVGSTGQHMLADGFLTMLQEIVCHTLKDCILKIYEFMCVLVTICFDDQ